MMPIQVLFFFYIVIFKSAAILIDFSNLLASLCKPCDIFGIFKKGKTGICGIFNEHQPSGNAVRSCGNPSRGCDRVVSFTIFIGCFCG